MKSSPLAFLAVVALAAGCVVPVNRVSRAALVPHMTPVSSSGAPMAQPVELRMGATSVAHVADPVASDPKSAVEVPGTQLEGGLRFRVGAVGSIGFLYARGLDSTAKPGKSTQVPVDGGDVKGGGMTLSAAIPVSGRWSLGVNAELLIWHVPWVEYSVCVENCAGVPLRDRSAGADSVAQAALGLVPTYRGDGLTWFGGVTVRNHPTIQQKDEEFGAAGGSAGDVEGGPGNVVVSAGVEAELGHGVRGSLVVYTPVAAAPIDYAPSLAASVIIPFGARTGAARP